MKFLYFLFIVRTIMSQPLYLNYQVQEDYIPIIGYHQIGDTTSSTIITREHFRDQVDYLTNTYGCNWITMETLVNYVNNKEKLPTKACVMNFDDGTTSHFNELCTLNTHKVPATWYIATDNIGTANGYYMTWDDVTELDLRTHDIEAHTKTHARLSDLTYNEQYDEIVGSKTDLENRGYTVKTFAYPYGDYNDDTLTIVSSNFDIGRDTRQDRSWKDVRTPVVSFNDDYLLHFYYIKPEGYTGQEFTNIIKYTGWWQFEDNYKIVSGSLSYTSSSSYLPTDTSYAILPMYNNGDEISTQFLTKYQGDFTIDMLIHNSTIEIGFTVYIDGVEYTPNSFGLYDVNMLYFQTSSGREFYNFYVNIETLSAGLHTLNIKNINGKRIYLDKFRIFSNVDQTFSDVHSYPDCNPEIDNYCSCDFFPTPSPTETSEPDPFCNNGILNGNICCTTSCGSCGGSGCGSRDGGPSNCCGSQITKAGNSCSDQSAPCLVTATPSPTLKPTTSPTEIGQTPSPTVFVNSDPFCDNGILSPSGDVCCESQCGTCGGSGCSSRPGGGSSCCEGTIETANNLCIDNTAPCVMTDITKFPTLSPSSSPTVYITPSPTQTGETFNPTYSPTLHPTQTPTINMGDLMCDNGILSPSGDVCCESQCGTCGGSGCGDRPGGSSSCCEGTIEKSNILCIDNQAPCVM